ncbi:unnamed protein product [Camellia sinensis]
MEAAAGVAAVRGVSMPMPTSQPSRKEWRVVSEHSVRNSSSEDLDRSKLGQSDERTIYEVQQGREPADVDFCSITIDGSLDNDILQQRLHGVARQREGLQQIEIELRAQIIARSEIIEIQNNFDAQITEHANANVKLQEQLHEMEQTIHELERKTEEKDRELHAIKLDNEAAWAKDDLLREQNKELQTFRVNGGAYGFAGGSVITLKLKEPNILNRCMTFKNIFRIKSGSSLNCRNRHRVAQETILFKDEQLRDAQAWITRAQEMDALHSTTNHSLQAELRERTEQYNQLWLGCQRQFAEMERLHLHTIQQLQLELADARERSGTYTEESRVSQTNSNDALQYGQNNGNQLDVDGGVTTNSNSGDLPNGNVENVTSFVSTGNASTQADHVHGAPIAPSSLLGMPTYLPPGQAASEGLQVPTHNQYPSSQTDQSLLRPDTNYDYEVSVNGQAIHPDYLDVHASQGMEPDTVITASVPEGQVLEQVDKSYLVAPQPQQSLQHISSQFREALRIDSLSQDSETKCLEFQLEQEKIITSSTNHGLEVQEFITEQASSANTQSSETPITHVNFSETTMNNATGVVSSESFVSSGEKNVHPGGKTSETALLDERSLLACIVRTIPPGSGGRIRISSTLPNRLSKMLAPLHWHDYKKKYGKLDDFVAGHPELFLIEEDYIQLREGAQEIIAATAAVAKVAAAAKTASSPYSSLLPSVAVTPMAQSHRLKRAPSIDSSRPASATDNHSQLSVQNQHSNGVHLNAGGISNIKILSKPKDPLELNGAESRPGQSSGLVAVGNGANPDRSGLGNSLSKGRSSANFVGKLQGQRGLHQLLEDSGTIWTSSRSNERSSMCTDLGDDDSI